MPPSPPRLFDRSLRALRRTVSAHRFSASDFLHRRAMADIVDRLESVARDFPLAHFCGVGGLREMLTDNAGVGRIVESDLAPARLGGRRCAVAASEDASPFAAGRFDLVVSLLTLHAVDDLVGALVQHRLSLKPDGLFIAAIFAEETLVGARAALCAAEAETSDGAGLRFAPFAGLKDLGAALQRAGFAMPVADLDSVSVRYDDPARLIADLRAMGETNALVRRGPPLSRAARANFLARLPGEARFDIAFLTGWAPAPSQPKPLSPGSARASLEMAVKNVDPPSD